MVYNIAVSCASFFIERRLPLYIGIYWIFVTAKNLPNNLWPTNLFCKNLSASAKEFCQK